MKTAFALVFLALFLALAVGNPVPEEAVHDDSGKNNF